MVSVTSASRNITSASRYHPRYQSRPSMYIRGLIPRNSAKLAESVPIVARNVQNMKLVQYFIGFLRLYFHQDSSDPARINIRPA